MHTSIDVNVSFTISQTVKETLTRCASPLLPNVERVTKIKILGIVIQDILSMDGQVEDVVSKGAQSLFTLRTLKCHGISGLARACTCNAILFSRLIASPMQFQPG